MQTEIGRELKASELKPRTVVVLEKPGRPRATVWVVQVRKRFVHFRAGVTQMELFLRRTGPDLEGLADEELPMKVYEYLGEV